MTYCPNGLNNGRLRRRKRTLTDADIQACVQLRLQGLRVNEVASAVGINERRVSTVLRATPITARLAKTRRRNLDPEVLATAAEMRRQGQSWKAIEGRCGVSGLRLSRYFRQRFGSYEAERCRYLAQSASKTKKNRNLQMIALREQGLSYRQIGERFGISVPAARSAVRRIVDGLNGTGFVPSVHL